VNEWVSEKTELLRSAHCGTFRRRTFQSNHLHWYWSTRSTQPGHPFVSTSTMSEWVRVEFYTSGHSSRDEGIFASRDRSWWCMECRKIPSTSRSESRSCRTCRGSAFQRAVPCSLYPERSATLSSAILSMSLPRLPTQIIPVLRYTNITELFKQTYRHITELFRVTFQSFNAFLCWRLWTPWDVFHRPFEYF